MLNDDPANTRIGPRPPPGFPNHPDLNPFNVGFGYPPGPSREPTTSTDANIPMHQQPGMGTHTNPTLQSYWSTQPYGLQPQFRNPDEWWLPRPEFPKFDGNPLNFRTFVNNFEKHIEARVNDHTLRLCYLN